MVFLFLQSPRACLQIAFFRWLGITLLQTEWSKTQCARWRSDSAKHDFWSRWTSCIQRYCSTATLRRLGLMNPARSLTGCACEIRLQPGTELPRAPKPKLQLIQIQIHNGGRVERHKLAEN